MRGGLLTRSFGIALAAALVLGVLAIPALAQQGLDLTPFPRSSATITLTNTGISTTPSQLNPGPITFTIQNNSDRARGVYVTGQDRAGTPILRYSGRIMPGASTRMEFWLYQGNVYTFRDYTSRRVVRGESVFVNTYSTQVTIPTPIPLGRGPRYPRRTGTIVITSRGIEVNPQRTDLGPITFTVTNESSRSRGVVITGQDRSGSPIIRYSRLLRPGSSTRVNFWLYEGKTYTIRDYTRRHIVRGEMRFTSSFRTRLIVNPGSPTGFGPGGAGEIPVY